MLHLSEALFHYFVTNLEGITFVLLHFMFRHLTKCSKTQQGIETKKLLKDQWYIFAIDALSNSLTITGQMGQFLPHCFGIMDKMDCSVLVKMS